MSTVGSGTKWASRAVFPGLLHHVDLGLRAAELTCTFWACGHCCEWKERVVPGRSSLLSPTPTPSCTCCHSQIMQGKLRYDNLLRAIPLLLVP